MKAVGYAQSRPISEPGALLDLELPDPEPGPLDLLVSVRAVSVNPVDVKQRLRREGSSDAPLVLGWDVSGVVLGTGEAVEGFAIGDEVWYAGDIGRPGCDAELHCVDARIVARKPERLSHVEAAAMPLTTLTAWECLFERLGYDPEPTPANRRRPLLLINGAGGLGSMILQLCRFADIPATATASREASRTWCLELGADEVVGHEQLGALDDASFPRIVCAHDTDTYFGEMARLVGPQGLVCGVASTKREHDLQPLMAKSAGFVWELMFTRSLFQTDDIGAQGEILRAAATLVDEGILRSSVTEVLRGLTAATFIAAHERLEAGRMIGKLVVDLSGEG